MALRFYKKVSLEPWSIPHRKSAILDQSHQFSSFTHFVLEWTLPRVFHLQTWKWVRMVLRHWDQNLPKAFYWVKAGGRGQASRASHHKGRWCIDFHTRSQLYQTSCVSSLTSSQHIHGSFAHVTSTLPLQNRKCYILIKKYSKFHRFY